MLLGSTPEGGEGRRGKSRVEQWEKLDCDAVSPKAIAYLRCVPRLGGPFRNDPGWEEGPGFHILG